MSVNILLAHFVPGKLESLLTGQIASCGVARQRLQTNNADDGDTEYMLARLARKRP
jgi:hypothetical protein